MCSEIHTKHINALCGQNVELFNVKPGGTLSNHQVSKGQNQNMLIYHDPDNFMFMFNNLVFSGIFS